MNEHAPRLREALLPVLDDGAGGMSEATPAQVTIHMCGGRQARICRVTGLPHEMSAWTLCKDGASRSCKDCGATAMALDLLELP